MTMEPTLIQLGAAGAGILLMALVAMVSLRTARARRAEPTDGLEDAPEAEELEAAPDTEVEAEVEVEAEEVAPEAAEVVTDPLPVLDEHDQTVLVRALRAQVRALEQALEALPAAVLTAPRPQVPGAPDPAGAYRRQVALTIRAISERTDHLESPQRTLARVTAAIERLDAPAGLTRPAIPAPAAPLARQAEGENYGQPDGPIAQPAARALTSVAVVEPMAQAGEFVPATPLDEHAEMDGGSTVMEPADAVEPERQRVLPVPPPAPAGPKRTKRRLRRSAA